MMEGGGSQGDGEAAGALREGAARKTIPLTLGHSQTQEMLDLTP